MGIFDNDFDDFHELIVECSTVNWRPDIPVRDRAVTVLDRLAEYLDARGQRAAAGGLRNFIADNFTAYPAEEVELDETDETDETDE